MQRKTVFFLLSRDKIRSKGQILEQRMQRKTVSSCSTSQMEWAANPQMVSSHRTEILILFVIVDIFIVTDSTEKVVDRHRLTTSLN